MSKPTRAQLLREQADLEAHAATLSKLLATLRAGLKNARKNPQLQAHLESEIAYYVARMAENQARRAEIRRQLSYS